MKGQNRRNNERSRKRLLLRYSTDADSPPRVAALRDISAGGLGIVAKDKLNAESFVVVWMPLSPESTRAIPLLCEVRSCAPMETDGNYRIGLQLVTTAEEHPQYEYLVENALRAQAPQLEI